MLRWPPFLLIVSHYQKQLLNQAKILVKPLRQVIPRNARS